MIFWGLFAELQVPLVLEQYEHQTVMHYTF